MKFNTYKFLYLFFVIIIFFFFNTIKINEGFTPSIREIYRPYIRKARIIGEGFYVEHTTKISNLLRKYGIM